MDKHGTRIFVTILGSGTCVPSLERSSCSVLIQGTEENFLLDVGPGTMGQLLKAGKVIHEIDALFLSHFHPDHAGELAGFLFSRKYADILRSIKSLSLSGGRGLNDFYDRLNLAFGNKLTPENFRLHELVDGSPVLFKSFTIESSPVVHRPESLAYSFISKENVKIVYTGDTDYSETLIQFAADADLLICESSFPDELKREGHLTPSLAGTIAKKARVRKLVLTHLYPECDMVDIMAQCRRTYHGPLVVAKDLMTIEL